MIVTSALIIWKGLMCVTGSESPVVVVLSGSMEPGFKRVSALIILHQMLITTLMMTLPCSYLVSWPWDLLHVKKYCSWLI